MASGPNTQEMRNPWDSLFASVTRPISSASGSSLRVSGGYTILIQHSITSASQRAHSLSAALNSTNVVTSMASLDITKSNAVKSRGDFFGMEGSFLTQRSFNELCIKCKGAVVFVCLLGNNGVLCLNDLDRADEFDVNGDEIDYQDMVKIGLNQRMNALRLFRKNGVVVNLASNPYGWNDETEISLDMNNLQTIADTIRAAVAKVRSYCPTQQTTTQKSTDTQRPVPIVFDSMTPLLAIHGAKNVSLLLQSFKQVQTQQKSIISPIIAPVLNESIRPSDHRLLEDIADAFISIKFRDDVKNSDGIVSGVLDIVRQGGGALGGKLMRGCIPFRIVSDVDNSMHRPTNARDRTYWLFDHVDDETKEESNQKLRVDIAKEEVCNDTEGSKTKPRIYLDDNDPEFDDFDEEDPDDDLDL